MWLSTASPAMWPNRLWTLSSSYANLVTHGGQPAERVCYPSWAVTSGRLLAIAPPSGSGRGARPAVVAVRAVGPRLRARGDAGRGGGDRRGGGSGPAASDESGHVFHTRRLRPRLCSSGVTYRLQSRWPGQE